jgi:hypothetical protein
MCRRARLPRHRRSCRLTRTRAPRRRIRRRCRIHCGHQRLRRLPRPKSKRPSEANPVHIRSVASLARRTKVRIASALGLAASSCFASASKAAERSSIGGRSAEASDLDRGWILRGCCRHSGLGIESSAEDPGHLRRTLSIHPGPLLRMSQIKSAAIASLKISSCAISALCLPINGFLLRLCTPAARLPN